MSCGTLSAISETVEWTIPDFFSLKKPEDIRSLRFSMVGSTWFLTVYLKVPGNRGGCLAIYVNREDVGLGTIETKTVNVSVGIKTGGSIVELQETSETLEEEDFCGWDNFLYWNDLVSRRSELVPSGNLNLVCNIRQEQTTELVKVHSRQAEIVELENLSSDFEDLLNSDRKCDVTINVQGKEFRAHRTILGARSTVFRAMYEHDTEEAKSGVLTIPDCDPESFDDFLHFLYTGRLELGSATTAYSLYPTAEKYDLQQLKWCCVNYMRQNMTPENVCDVIVLADQFSDHQLQSLAQEFFNENSPKILLTSEWSALLRRNLNLAEKCLKEMASANLKKS